MNKEELDRLLDAMVQYAEGISDLIFVAGSPMQVETQGELKPFESEPPLTSECIEAHALLYCNNKMKMVQRIDSLSLHKPRKSTSSNSLFADLKMQELRNKSKR